MSLKGYVERLRFIDSLISRRATGSPTTLANKMQLSKSGLNKFLNEMKEIGFPIKYDYVKQTYYYEREGCMVDDLFRKEELSKEEMRKLTGGFFAPAHDHSRYHFRN